MKNASTRERRLVVIDMQHCFRDESSQWCVPRYDEVVPVIESLQNKIGGSAVFTKFVADPEESGAWGSYYERWDQMRLPESDGGWDLTMDTSTDNPTFTKGTFSKWGPELAALVPAGAEMVLTGVATDCCILATALGAVDAGRFVTVVADGCAAVSDEAQAQTLALLELLAPMCTVVTSAELLSGIASEAALAG